MTVREKAKAREQTRVASALYKLNDLTAQRILRFCLCRVMDEN
jgi:hypothetical protein